MDSPLPSPSVLVETQCVDEESTPAYDNGALDVYYQLQLQSDLWPAAFAQLKKPLPVAWRMMLSRPISAVAAKAIEAVYGSWVSPIPTVPGAYHIPQWSQFTADRQRQQGLEALLHQFTECGALFRQEMVSMLPAVAMDLKAHHTVLDLCCAPGSKSLQILDIMSHDAAKQSAPPGLLVINDVGQGRLRAALGRMRHQWTTPMITTCCDARRFPTFYVHGRRKLKFDRVLADVLCSGDGTLRKNPHIWFSWDVRTAIELHPVQVDILKRGLKLLAFEGKLVYSTCTLDPVQDEAVVAAAIQAVQEECPHFTCEVLPLGSLDGVAGSPGLVQWAVPALDFTQTGTLYTAYDAVPPQVSRAPKIVPSMFPNYASPMMQLKHCLRVLPEDSGGFFMALITKHQRKVVISDDSVTPMAAGEPCIPVPPHLVTRLQETPSRSLYRGVTVKVLSNGYLGVVEGRGGGRFAGLFKVVYDDGTHYHCHPKDLVVVQQPPKGVGQPKGLFNDPTNLDKQLCCEMPAPVECTDGPMSADDVGADAAFEGDASQDGEKGEELGTDPLDDRDVPSEVSSSKGLSSASGSKSCPHKRLHFKKLLRTLDISQSGCQDVITFFGLADDASQATVGQLCFPLADLTFSEDSIRLVPRQAKSLLLSCRNREAQLKVFASGLLLFLRVPDTASRCPWRPTTEAAAVLRKMASRRVICFSSLAELCNVLSHGSRTVQDLQALAAKGLISGMHSCCAKDAIEEGAVLLGIDSLDDLWVDGWLNAHELHVSCAPAYRQQLASLLRQTTMETTDPLPC